MSSPKEFSITKSTFSHQKECGTMLAQSGNKGLSRSSYVVMLIDIVELLRELQAPMPLVRPKMVVRRPVIWNFLWPTKDSILTTPYTQLHTICVFSSQISPYGKNLHSMSKDLSTYVYPSNMGSQDRGSQSINSIRSL